MSRPIIPASLRASVPIRAHSRCEYCLLHADDAVLPHEIDHAIATQHRGPTVSENLAFSCWDCNHLKGPNLASVDPSTGKVALLFHPRRDRWDEHFRLEGAGICGLTPTGRATEFLLQFNAPERVRQRQHLQTIGRYPR